MASVPFKLKFQSSHRRKQQQLARMSLRIDHLPGKKLKSYLDSSSNTNIYPSSLSITTLAPYSDLPPSDEEMAQALLPPDPNTRPRCFRNTFQEIIFVFAVMMATSSTTFIQGVIVINTATIGTDLKMNAAQMTWIAAAIGYIQLLPVLVTL